MLKRAVRVGRRFENPVPVDVGGLGMIFKVLPLYLMNREERTPREPLGPFRTDAAVYVQPPESGLRVTWFGHSSTLVEMDGARLLIDPVWDERASPRQWAGPKRFFAPTMGLEELPRIDAVILSHDHYDHLGEGTVRKLAALEPLAGAQWVTPLGVGKILESFGVRWERITELDWTESASVAGGAVTLTALPARHFSGRSLLHRFETLWASFVIAGERHRVFYGADSGEWGGFAEIGAEHGPFDLTMLEIGAYNELWKDIHMGPDGAARTYEALGGPERAGVLMPIHWGLFDLALHAWRQPIARVLEIADAKGWPVFSPKPGEPSEVGVVRSEWWR